MWTIKIVLLVAGVIVTALTSQPSANAARCADAPEAAVETVGGISEAQCTIPAGSTRTAVA